MYINTKFDEIHLRGLKFSTAVNDNDNIINIQKYQYIMAVYLISGIQRTNGTDTAFHRMNVFVAHWSCGCDQFISK